MAPLSCALTLLLCLASLRGAAEPCGGPHCLPGRDWSRHSGGHFQHPPAGRRAQVYPGYQQDGQPGHHGGGAFGHYGPDGTRRTNPRTITAEVFHPGCAGGSCPTGITQKPVGEEAQTRECKGIECKLPPRMRHTPKTCVGPSCGGQEDARSGSSPVLVTDRAAQFLGEFSEFGAERGASALGIQLTCDMKPGTNEVPSEDALVLQVQLSKGQEKLVEALRAQRDELKELQGLLVEQQAAVVSQQQEILEQQRRMFEQMEQVKAQYSIFLESIKQTTFPDLHAELDSPMDAYTGPVRPHRAQQALSVHKVDMEASVMEMGRPLLACGSCGPEEYCGYSGGRPRCERCTVCPAGFFLVAQCSVDADRICQDRDECLEINSLCGDQQKCLNTPGGFRCQGMTERDANSGMCGHGYFYHSDMDECQACAECDGETVLSPCTYTADTACSGPGTTDSPLSLSWAGTTKLRPTKSPSPGQTLSGVQLRIQGRADGAVVTVEDGRLAMRQHGLVWMDENLSVSHNCRSFIQVCLRVNGTDGSEGRDLSGVRVEQRDGRALQSVSLSGVAEVAPGHLIALSIRGASHHCNHSGDGTQMFDVSGAPFSLLWLSHDTGAVAMTAQASVSAHYHTSYRPVLRTTLTSDPYVVGLTHDGRGVRFAEAGTVRFVYQQAFYSMGQACVSEGFNMLAYISRNGTGAELCRAFKPGVHYRDTSMSLSGATKVGPGDTLAFEVLSPAQCNVRYFGDDTGISILSLVWVPASISSALTASVAQAGLPSGAVRNKLLFFRQTSPQVAQVTLQAKASPDQARDFVFREGGTASVALDLKLIHSCNLVKVTLHRRSDLERPAGGRSTEGLKHVPLAQQVGGQMAEGSQWASVGLRTSFQVQNGTAVFFTIDCVRGRINQISHQTESGVSVMWVAA